MKPRQIIIRDDANERWLSLSALAEQRSCEAADAVLPLLAWAEAQAVAGRWVCGFVAYEAAGACDEALQPKANPDATLPLVWFGAFEQADPVADPALAAVLPVPAPALQAEWSAEQYRVGFERVKAYLGAGDSYQVNLTFKLRGQFEGDSYALFCQLCANQAGRYSAYLAFEDQVVLSASPELFFERRGKQILTRPMKGTTRRGQDPEEDAALAEELRKDPKNQAENLMIVDMIRNDLGKIAEIGSVQVPQLFEVECYPRIQQMTTSVLAKSAEPLPVLMQGLFPCASITGAPKARTVAIIKELEPSPRGLYTGSIGLIRPGGDCQFSVVIRSAVWDRRSGDMSFGVGSGLVWDSRGDDEHAECLLKANILEPRAKPGLFETIHWNSQTGYRLLPGHCRRMARSAAALGIAFDEQVFNRALESRPLYSTARVRLMLSAAGEFSREVSPAPEPLAVMRLALCPWPVQSDWPLLAHKVDRRDLYERAVADSPPCDQVLLWNEAGNITESNFANLVIREGERLITPPLRDGLLPGVFREQLLLELEIEQGSIGRQRLLAADEIWLINSLRGWMRAELLPEALHA